MTNMNATNQKYYTYKCPCGCVDFTRILRPVNEISTAMGDTVVSTQLSMELDLYIGTTDYIKCERMRTLKYYPKSKEDNIASYVIGSACDGLGLEGSDVDIMYVDKRLSVIDTLRGDEADRTSPSSYLLAYSSPSSSAYRYIELHIQLNEESSLIEELFRSSIYFRGRLLATSSLFIQQSSFVEGGTVVGPSLMIPMSSNISYDLDNVQGFHCNTFPLMAHEWIARKRKYTWPSRHLIQLSKEIGYHLVPIGDYNTTMQHFQWRISFVLQECLLVRTFSQLQMKVYALMKIIKSNVLSVYRSQETSQSLITSFHIKTLMFWTIECTPKYIWCEKYLFLCKRICLMFLKGFVRSNFMPHYFMPQCNLFKKHVQKDLKKIVKGELVSTQF